MGSLPQPEEALVSTSSVVTLDLVHLVHRKGPTFYTAHSASAIWRVMLQLGHLQALKYKEP